MPAAASVQVFGEDVVRRRFLRFADNAEDASGAFRAIAGILERSTQLNFQTRGTHGGSRWRDLRPATRARKRRERLDPRILQATHRLIDSLLDRGHPEHIDDIGPDHLRWGSSVPYGVYHQSTKPRRVIPYRPPVRLNEQERREVVREMQRSLVGTDASPRGARALLRDVGGRFRRAHR